MAALPPFWASMTASPVARPSWIVRSARLAIVAAASLALSVCGETPTGLRAGADGFARLAFQPELRPADRPWFQNTIVGIDKVYLVIRAADGTIVFERLVDFPVGQDAVEIVADVPVRSESERFTAQFELRNGSTPMFRGTQEVIARPGLNAPTQTTVTLSFVGPGATAASVSVSPPTSTLLAGASSTLTANARDAAGATIVNALLTWSSSDPSLVAVSPTGGVTAGNRRGTATITAATYSGVLGTADVTVTLPPASVVVESPAGLSGRVGSTLATPFTVRVLAEDNVPVSGTVVAFAALANGAQVGSATATTGTDGRASTTMTLGGAISAQSFRATVAGLPPVTLSVDATVGLPEAIAAVNSAPQSETIGRPLPQPFTVRVTDRFDNPVPDVSVAWTRIAGNGTLGAVTTTTDPQGRAQVSYTLGTLPGAESVRATITTATGTATATFTATAVALPASRILVVSGDAQGGTVGTAAGQPLVVRVTDALNNNIAGATVVWTVTGPATISAASTQTTADGTAQVTATYGTQPGGVTVRATLGTASVTFALTASVGAPAKLTVVAGGGQSAPVNTAVGIAPSVRVSDQFDNPISGVSVTFAASGGGAVTGSPALSNSSGIATLGGWTLGATPGPQSLAVTAGTASTVIGVNATAPVGPPVLAMATQPSGSAQNTIVLAQQPVVQLKNSAGGNLSVAGVVVSVAVTVPFVPIRDGEAAVVAGTTLAGTLTATTNGSGVATFTNLSLLGPVGSVTLDFTAAGYTGVTSSAINLTAGPAVSIAATSTTTLSGTAGSLATPLPQVIVKDAALNPVSGVTVTFATPAAGNGTVVTGAGAVTNASGLASPTSWTYDAVAGTDVLQATVTGLIGSPVTFTATTTPGAATQLLIVSGSNQTAVTGNPIGLPMIVVAKDALNNLVSGVNVTFTTTVGGGTPTTQTVATDGTGQASFTLTVGPPGAQSVQACLPSCGTGQVTFSAMSIPVGADAIWNGSTSTNWSTAANWTPAVVPTGSNNVFIPAGTPNSPALSASGGVGHLTLAAGAALSLGASNLTLVGDLLATGASMSSTGGSVYICGGTRSIAGGSGPLLVDCSATVNLAGTVTISGALTAQGGAALVVGTANATVTGALTMVGGSSARLKMNNAAGVLTVHGDAHFSALDAGDADQTAGTLQVKGNFTAETYGQAFRASGTHLTRFIGTGPQVVHMQYTSDQSRFANLEFASNSTVTLTSNIPAMGTVNVTGTTVVTGSVALISGGLVTAAPGTNLSGLANLSIVGAGTTFPILQGTGPSNVYLTSGGTIGAPAGTFTFPTNLIVQAGTSLDIGTSNLTIAGALTFSNGSGARLRMIDAAGVLTVNGNVYFSGLDAGSADQTAGTLQLKGNFTAENYGQAFRASGAHLTRFIGTGPQLVYMQYTNDQSRFANLEFASNSSVTLLSNIPAIGSVNVTGTTVVTGSALIANGLVTAAVGTNLTGLSNLSVVGAGNTFPLLLGSAPPVVYLTSGGTINAPTGIATFATNLVVQAGTSLDIGGNTLTITGNLSFPNGSGARLKMNNPAGMLTVNGNAYFSALDAGSADQTAGTLQLKGNFLAENFGQAFRASGTHLTRFIGTGPQVVHMQYTNDQSRFANLEFASNNTVTLTSNIPAVGTVNVTGTTAVTGAVALIASGLVTAAPGTTLSGLVNLSVVGPGNTFPLLQGSGPNNVYLTSGGTISAPATPTILPTNLIVQAGTTLDIGSNTLTIAGHLTYPNGSGARLKMIDAAGVLTVNGNVYFSGLDAGSADQTAGTLQLKGNFTAENFGQAFRASGTHLTRFIGPGPQSVYMQYTNDQSRFANLEFVGNNTVNLTSNIPAIGTVNVTGTTTVAGTVALVSSGLVTAAAGTNLSSLANLSIVGAGNTFPLLQGSGPTNVYLTSGGTISAPAGTASLPSNLVVQAGTTLDIGASSLTITGSLTYPTGSGARLRMNNPAGALVVHGNASFSALDAGSGDLTAGVFELRGNFSAGTYGQAFLATGSHLMRFAGNAAQSVNMQYTGGGQSQFASVEITNASAGGVTPTSNIPIASNLTQLGRLTITSVAVNVTGTLSLGPSSNTSVVGGALNKASCSVISGTPTISGFSCP